MNLIPPTKSKALDETYARCICGSVRFYPAPKGWEPIPTDVEYCICVQCQTVWEIQEDGTIKLSSLSLLPEEVQYIKLQSNTACAYKKSPKLESILDSMVNE